MNFSIKSKIIKNYNITQLTNRPIYFTLYFHVHEVILNLYFLNNKNISLLK
jgi:hypothetical protein